MSVAVDVALGLAAAGALVAIVVGRELLRLRDRVTRLEAEARLTGRSTG